MRRTNKRRNEAHTLILMYSNIQGITKKRDSLINIMDELKCDVCLLAETMTMSSKSRRIQKYNITKICWTECMHISEKLSY